MNPNNTEKTQTSIGWLLFELSKIGYLPHGVPTDLINQANQMHNAEIEITENTSDGFHTFAELYDIRKAYNVALFNEWGRYDIPNYHVHKSWRHYDGQLCFGGGWFIVCAMLPSGQISNHYKAEDWELFKVPKYEKALYPYDGHTTKNVIDRLISMNYV